MVKIKINVTGLLKITKNTNKIFKRHTDKLNKAIHDAGFFLEGEVKESIAGRRAEKKSVDTGEFLQNVSTNNKEKLISDVFSPTNHGIFLEKGTSRIKPRRHFGNSLKRNKSRILKKIKKDIAM